MRTIPSLSKRSLLTGLTVAATLLAGTVASTVAATPSRAATCNGYVGLTFDDGPSNDQSDLGLQRTDHDRQAER
jgi:hypothetical protein